MREIRHYIIVCAMSLLAFVGCDVHEFPHPDKTELIPFELHLNFDTELPFYTEVPYTRSGDNATKLPLTRHDLRYVIKAYRTDNVVGENRVADTTFVFTKSDFTNLNFTAPLELREGSYILRVWCDYVDARTTTDKYYDTRDFAHIRLLNEEEHSGSNDYRDAFRGTTSANVVNKRYYTEAVGDTFDNSATIEMSRPMGKFEFISTDVEAFLTRTIQMILTQGGVLNLGANPTFEQMLQSVNINDFDVVITYEEYLPCEFNMFTDKVSDSSFNRTSFTSKMYMANDTEMSLGSDFVFVRDSGTTLAMTVKVFDKNGNQMSASRPVSVPIMRSKHTIVRGEFLTSQATSGAVINPGYDGPDINIPI